MQYLFLDQGDEELIRVSELPVEEGIAVEVNTTGYEIGADEIVRMTIVDFAGNELFSQMVKPQNIEEWGNDEASGGITPGDVAEAPELYQFEDEISDLFENASIVVGQHIDFIHEMIEASWVSLPAYEGFDLMAEFCVSHATADYPGQPAAVASLQGIASYYGLSDEAGGTGGVARMVAESYVKLVEEHARERVAKGPEHWAAYERKLEEDALNDAKLQEGKRRREIQSAGINAVLWLCAAAIFSNLAVQLHIRAVDFGFVALAALAAVFFAVRWIMCLVRMYTLNKQGK